MPTIDSPFGTLEVPEDQIIAFPAGLEGFPKARRFALQLEDPETTGVFWLICVDDPTLAFLCINPWEFLADYSLDIPVHDADVLGLDSPNDALVVALVSVREDEAPTANLLGPVVVNTKLRLGRQVVLDGPLENLRVPLPTADDAEVG